MGLLPTFLILTALRNIDTVLSEATPTFNLQRFNSSNNITTGVSGTFTANFPGSTITQAPKGSVPYPTKGVPAGPPECDLWMDLVASGFHCPAEGFDECQSPACKGTPTKLDGPRVTDLSDQCILWDPSCKGDKDQARLKFFNGTNAERTVELLKRKKCFVNQTADCDEWVAPEILNQFADLKDWMRTPECDKDNDDFNHGGWPCCEHCQLRVENVDIFYWPEPDADTSCLSIVEDKRPLDHGMTANDGYPGGYWGCTLDPPSMSYFTQTKPPHETYGSTLISTLTTARMYTLNGITFKQSLFNPWESPHCPTQSWEAPPQSAKYSSRPSLTPFRIPHNITRSAGPVPSTLVSDGFTYTSPSIYAKFHNIFEFDLCGNRGSVDNIKETLLSFAPGELSTIRGPFIDPEAKYHTEVFNFKDLPCPPQSIMEGHWYKPEPGVPYAPIIALPQKVRDIDPWYNCTDLYFRGYDPPKVLVQGGPMAPTPAAAEGQDSVVTPAAQRLPDLDPPKPAAVQAAPEPKKTGSAMVDPDLNKVKDEPKTVAVEKDPSKDSPATVPPPVDDPAKGDPAKNDEPKEDEAKDDNPSSEDAEPQNSPTKNDSSKDDLSSPERPNTDQQASKAKPPAVGTPDDDPQEAVTKVPEIAPEPEPKAAEPPSIPEENSEKPSVPNTPADPGTSAQKEPAVEDAHALSNDQMSAMHQALSPGETEPDAIAKPEKQAQRLADSPQDQAEKASKQANAAPKQAESVPQAPDTGSRQPGQDSAPNEAGSGSDSSIEADGQPPTVAIPKASNDGHEGLSSGNYEANVVPVQAGAGSDGSGKGASEVSSAQSSPKSKSDAGVKPALDDHQTAESGSGDSIANPKINLPETANAHTGGAAGKPALNRPDNAGGDADVTIPDAPADVNGPAKDDMGKYILSPFSGTAENQDSSPSPGENVVKGDISDTSIKAVQALPAPTTLKNGVTAAPFPNGGVSIYGTKIEAGAPAATVQGQKISVDKSGKHINIDGEIQDLPSRPLAAPEKAGAAGNPVDTIELHNGFTAVRHASAIEIAGATLSAGAVAATIPTLGKVSYNAKANALVVDSSTEALPAPPSPTSIPLSAAGDATTVLADGVTAVVGSAGLSIHGTTLTAGAPAAVVSGASISYDATRNEVMMGTRTETLPSVASDGMSQAGSASGGSPLSTFIPTGSETGVVQGTGATGSEDFVGSAESLLGCAGVVSRRAMRAMAWLTLVLVWI